MAKKKKDGDDAHVAAVRELAKKYAPTIHLFIWSLVNKEYPGIHPAEVYRAIVTDPDLEFDGKTSIVSVRKNTK
jgi:hypothetical protein